VATGPWIIQLLGLQAVGGIEPDRSARYLARESGQRHKSIPQREVSAEVRDCHTFRLAARVRSGMVVSFYSSVGFVKRSFAIWYTVVSP
jgi:hypothetical protein